MFNQVLETQEPGLPTTRTHQRCACPFAKNEKKKKLNRFEDLVTRLVRPQEHMVMMTDA